MVRGLGLRVQGLRFRVQGFGVRVEGPRGQVASMVLPSKAILLRV